VKRFTAVSPKLFVPQHLLVEFQSFKNDSGACWSFRGARFGIAVLGIGSAGKFEGYESSQQSCWIKLADDSLNVSETSRVGMTIAGRPSMDALGGRTISSV
jgi:hypothetical protein